MRFTLEIELTGNKYMECAHDVGTCLHSVAAAMFRRDRDELVPGTSDAIRDTGFNVVGKWEVKA